MIPRSSIKYTIQSHAKVNLFLYVLGKRKDEYHEIYTLLLPISLYDTIVITPSISTMLNCNRSYIPTNSRNIIMKVHDILKEEYSLKENYSIDLIKRIPVGAGLGGGSSNAASYLKLVNEVSSLNLSREDMVNILSRVGSDTVFFLETTPSIGRGRGEILEKFYGIPKLFLLIINPKIFISTKDIYNDKRLKYTDKSLIPGIRKEMNYNNIVSLMKNDLENIVFNKYPIIKSLVDDLNIHGKGLVSGSGSTVYGIYENEEKRSEAHKYFVNKYEDYYIQRVENIV